MSAWIGIAALTSATLVWKALYRHGGRCYAEGKTERIDSPRSFRAVYGLLQLIAPLVAAAAFLYDHPVLLKIHESAWLSWAGLAVVALGLTIFVAAKLELAEQYSPCFDSLVPHRIVRTGIYRSIRHPIYTGNLIAFSGFFLATASPWLAALTLVLLLYYRAAADQEERALATRFPGYRVYMRSTGRFLPRLLRQRTKPPAGVASLAGLVNRKIALFSLLPIAAALASVPASSQTSASFRLGEYAFNAGGETAAGPRPSSGSFRLSLASLGDGLAAAEASSSGFELQAGRVSAFRPPGETAASCASGGACLVFDSRHVMTWPAERSAGSYNLYRDVTGGGYGLCEQPGLDAPTATDAVLPPAGEALFYLVTTSNRLGEEGTKGFARNGETVFERGGVTCR